MTRPGWALEARPRSEMLFLALAGTLGSTAVAVGMTSPTIARLTIALAMLWLLGSLGFAAPRRLLYVLIGGSFGLIVYFIYSFAFQSLGIFAQRNPLAHLVGRGIASVFLLILTPVLIAIGMFINAAILHVCLMIVGGAKQSFETTFRVVCFSAGSVYPLMIIPLCGGVIAGVWGIVLRCIGLARAHETDTGRAVLAVFLPLIVCCGGGLLLAILFGGIGALSHYWNY